MCAFWLFFFFFYGAAYCHALKSQGPFAHPEAHHEAYQSMISAVPQTTENNLSGPPGEIHHPCPNCPNYQRWHTAPSLLQDSESSFILLITHSTEWILLKDADSVKMLPQVAMSCNQTREEIDLLRERRSDATVGESDCRTILLSWKKGDFRTTTNGRADGQAGQDRSAVIHPSSSHARRCWLSRDNQVKEQIFEQYKLTFSCAALAVGTLELSKITVQTSAHLSVRLKRPKEVGDEEALNELFHRYATYSTKSSAR
ncbi:hypothetical protein J6590_065936 [Homalodisca vitripennis]|nr:hypothetical protein J6590_065936 [Homalodisca vitripennis]